MPSAMRHMGTVRKGDSEKVTLKLRNTWTVGKRIFWAKGTVGKLGELGEQRVGENKDKKS